MRPSVVAALSAAACLFASSGRSAETHTIDPVHSTALFKIRHMGASNLYGRFNDISGTIVIDAKDPSKSSVDVTVKVDSLDTGNAKRDQHLKSPDFFAAKQFPAISFKGKDVKVLPDGGFEVAGQLTLHGVTKDLKATVKKVGTGKGMQGGALTGFETSFKIKRSDHDMKQMIPAAGDEVEITISVECATK